MSSNVSECHIYDDMEPFTYFYYLIFLVGIIGSCFALWAFTQDQKPKSLSIYLINLLTADLLLTLALPVKIIVDLGIASWSLRIFHCQVTACCIYLSMYVSMVFLGLVGADRCLQLAHSSGPFRLQEPGFARTLCAVVWLTMLLLTVPNMAIPTRHVPERPGLGCIDLKTRLGRHWHVFSSFVCTALFLHVSAVLLLCPALLARRCWRLRHGPAAPRARRALLQVLLVSGAHLLCFVPFHAVRIPYTLSQGSAQGCALRRALFRAKEGTLLLAVGNLCLDPILYYHLSSSFRSKLSGAPGEGKERTAPQGQRSSERQSGTQGWPSPERSGNQGWESPERSRAQGWESPERSGNQGWPSPERSGTQGWPSPERSRAQGWESPERSGNQGWQSPERSRAQGWQSPERSGNQGWESPERSGNQGWESPERSRAQGCWGPAQPGSSTNNAPEQP